MNQTLITDGKLKVTPLGQTASVRNVDAVSGALQPPWPDDLFPLRLSLFESYMLADDRPTHPMTIFVELRLSGDLQRDEFLAAYQQTLDRHPLLQCVVTTLRGRWCWTPACDLVRPVEWHNGSSDNHPDRHTGIDLHTEPGLRTWVVHRPEESRVVFQFHHAATDGLGAVRVIGDLLAIYGQLTTPAGEEAPELLPVTYERLRDRGQLWPNGKPCRGTLKQLIVRTWEMMTKLPTPIAPPSTSLLLSKEGLRFPNMVSQTIDRQTTRQIKREAARRNVTTNDLYSLAMFQALRRWNERHGSDKGKGTLRLGVPVSLRTPLHDDSPAANILSYMALTSFGDEQPQELLQKICDRTAQTVGGVDAPLFTLGVGGVVSRLPWLGKLCGRTKFCFSTAMLTNIGEVRRQVGNHFPLKKGRCIAGSVKLEALLGTAPVRPQTSVAIAMGTYGGHLFINANCDPQVFSKADAQAFLDLYIEKLRSLVEEPQQTSPQSA